MRYRVSHRTVHAYDEPVTDSFGLAYLTPRSLPWQEVADHTVTIAPDASDVAQEVDYHGNLATYFQVTERHTTLEVDALSEVTVTTPLHTDGALGGAWERARPRLEPTLPGAWQATELAGEVTDDSWTQWRTSVPLERGSHRVRVRAINKAGEVQTGAYADVLPDGATGWHEIYVDVV